MIDTITLPNDAASAMQAVSLQQVQGLITAATTASSANSITYLSKSGHNSQAMIMGGVLYTCSGHPATYNNATTGRGATGVDPYWGPDDFKQVQFPESSPVVAAGGFVHGFAWALLANSNLYTWGYNQYGQCGLGHALQVGIPTLSATNVQEVFSHPSNGEYAASDTRLFYKSLDGKIYGCGYNTYGALGIGTTVASNPTWAEVVSLRGIVSKLYNLGATFGCTVVLTTTGKILVAGYNGYGQLGNGNATNLLNFTDVTTQWAGTGVTVTSLQASGGFAHSASSGQTVGGTVVMLIGIAGQNKFVKTCGDNRWKQLGNGTTTGSYIPQSPNLGGSAIEEIAAFSSAPLTVFARTSNNQLYSWGYNDQGQCGKPVAANTSIPSIVASSVAKLACDGLTSWTYGYLTQGVYIGTNGQLYAAGENSSGYLGNGTFINAPGTFTRALIPTNETVVDIGHYTTSTHGRIFIALAQSGNMYMWGYNGNSGLIANSSVLSSPVPVLINLPQPRKVQ